MGYYRRFIKGFSAVVRPLTDLTKGLESQSKKIAKKTKVQRGEKEEESFQNLKEACISTPILGFPDYTLPFILHTDASTFGLGAVLYQKQKDGTWVIAYASRSLSRSEANYTPHKLEFLALKWAITEKFKDYLYGGNILDCYTDNNPLTYILTSDKLDACGQRWVAELASYNFNLHYKSGATNIEADCLSRIQWKDILNQTEESRFQHLPYTSMQAIIQGISPQIILADSIILNKQVIPVEWYVANQPGLTKEDWKQLQSADHTLSMVIKHLREKTWNDRKRPKHMPIQLKLYYRVRKNFFFFLFFKVFGPLVPLFWILVTSPLGFKASGFCLIHYFCGGECNVHSPRFTSGATLADLLAAGAQPVTSPHACVEVGLGTVSNMQSHKQKTNALPLCQQPGLS